MPTESLLLQKATGAVPHTGGKRFEPTSDYYADAPASGSRPSVPSDPGEVPKVERVELYPPQMVLEGGGSQQQMIVRAKYSDGTVSRRDRPGRVPHQQRQLGRRSTRRAGHGGQPRRGLRHGPVRDQHRRQPGARAAAKDLPYSPPANARRPTTSTSWSAPSSDKLRILPSEICTDAVFLRRVTLDITGLLPTDEEYRAFLADSDPAKRAKLVDRLLASARSSPKSGR